MLINKKQRYFTYLIIITILILISWLFVYYIFWSSLYPAFGISNSFLILFWFIIFRILFASLFSIYFFYKWFTQEVIYLSDAHFLFALYFFLMIFGKINDLFLYLALPVDIISEEILFTILRIRFFIMAVNTFPLLYIGLEALFMILGIYTKDFTRKKFNRLRISIILTLTGLVLGILILSPNFHFLMNAQILPLLTTLTMLGIVVMFIYMYRKERLSQAHGLIIGIGFLLFIITSFIFQFLMTTEDPANVLLAEILNTMVYSIVLLGFLIKPGFGKKVSS